MELVQSSLYRKLSQFKVHHIAFWAVYFTFWVLFFHIRQDWSASVMNATITVAIHSLVSYFNIYVLFPKFLKRKEYLNYTLSIMLSVSLACFMLVIIYLSVNTISLESKESVWSWKFFGSNAISISYTVAITMSLKMVKQWYEREKMTRNLEKINTETELKYLKSQINPHFLFNSLNSIYALTLKKSDMAPELVLKLSEILRYVLYEAREKYVDLEKEVNYVQSYLDLEKMRHGDRLKVTFEQTGELKGKQIAPMLFLTFIENSFKHGIHSRAGEGFVEVVISVTDHHLHFEIRNSKPGRANRPINGAAGGIGLENVRKRLELLYPERYELEVAESTDNYVVRLDMNLNVNEEYHEQ